jgi:predicted DNA-binding transcriptional regulator YafY
MAVKLMSMFMEDILPPPTQRLLREQVGRADAVLERANEDFLRQWPKKIRVLPAGFSPSPPTVSRAVVEAVYSAVLTRRKVHGTYTKADGSSKEHDINIFGIVLRPPITYLVATYRPGHGPFTLALHRLTKARVLDVPTEVPKDFDLDQFIASGELHYRLGGSIQLRVRAAQKIGQLWQETPLSAGQTMTLDKYGWFIVQANVVDSLNLRAYLLGLGDQIEVLGPAALRSTMAEQADSLAKLYPRS